MTKNCKSLVNAGVEEPAHQSCANEKTDLTARRTSRTGAARSWRSLRETRSLHPCHSEGELSLRKPDAAPTVLHGLMLANRTSHQGRQESANHSLLYQLAKEHNKRRVAAR